MMEAVGEVAQLVEVEAAAERIVVVAAEVVVTIRVVQAVAAEMAVAIVPRTSMGISRMARSQGKRPPHH